MIHSKVAAFASLALFSQLCMAMPCGTMAGTLDDFEEEASRSDSGGGTGESDDDGCDDSFLCGLLKALLSDDSERDTRTDQPSQMGTARLSDPVDHRHMAKGDWLTPLAQLELYGSDVSRKIDSRGYRIELNMGAIGVFRQQTRFRESPTGDEMRLIYNTLALRILSSKNMALNGSLGEFQLRGNSSHHGMAYGLELSGKFDDYWGWQFRPTWVGDGLDIKDAELALVFSRPYIGVRAGYRWLETDSVDLNGPFVGIQLSY